MTQGKQSMPLWEIANLQRQARNREKETTELQKARKQ